MRVDIAQQLGQVPAVRYEAQRLRATVERAAREGEPITLDFAGVRMMSPSVADELLAKPFSLIRAGQLRIEGLAPHLTSLAKFVRSRPGLPDLPRPRRLR